MTRGQIRGVVVPVVVFALLAIVPKLGIDIPVLFPGSLDSPGTLQLLALMLTFAGLALTYDLLFGFTGLMSFGHALYFAVGVYVAAVAMTKWHWGFWPSILFTCAVGLAAAGRARHDQPARHRDRLRDGDPCLRAGRQRARVQESRRLDRRRGRLRRRLHEAASAAFVGIFNTKNLYWLALVYAAVVFVVGRWAINSSPGKVWQAIRENELRVEVLGMRPFDYKLMSCVLASFLATLGGIVYLMLISGASPDVTTPPFTLALLIMVVIGGTGSRWGALIGGVVYTYLDHRLADLAGSSAVSGLPSVLRVPLREPTFILGLLFILTVYFAPGGLARLGQIRRRPVALEEAL